MAARDSVSHDVVTCNQHVDLLAVRAPVDTSTKNTLELMLSPFTNVTSSVELVDTVTDLISCCDTT